MSVYTKDDFKNRVGVSGTIVTIPDYFTAIGKYAFEYQVDITRVVIPDSVVTIGEMAFYACSLLITITIPESVMTIGRYAFGDCMSLTDVIFKTGSQLLSIGAGAFSNSKLSSVNIPADVDFGKDVFKGTPCNNKSIFQAGNTIINCALVIYSDHPSSISSTPPTTFFESQNFTISKPESSFSNEDGIFSIPLSYSQVGKSVSFIQLSLMEKTCTNVTTESVIALSPSTSEKFERGNFTAPQVNVDTTKFSSSILVVDRSKNNAIGVLKFCVRTDGFLEIDGTETSVSFRKDKISLSFDLSSNSFSVESNTIKADDVQTSETNVTTSYNVTAFRCDEDSFDVKKTNIPIQQNALVYICLKPHSGPVFIESFSMGFYQGSSTEKFKAVGIDGYVSSLSYVSTAVKTKKVTSRVISTFFNDEGTSFDVRGNAYLAFDSTRIRQLRYLQETDNAGQATFKMNIGLENKKILNDGSKSTVETPEILIAICGLLIFSIGFIIVKKMKK